MVITNFAVAKNDRIVLVQKSTILFYRRNSNRRYFIVATNLCVSTLKMINLFEILLMELIWIECLN